MDIKIKISKLISCNLENGFLNCLLPIPLTPKHENLLILGGTAPVKHPS